MEIENVNNKKAKVTFANDTEYFIYRRNLSFSPFRLMIDYFGAFPPESQFPYSTEIKHKHLGRVLGRIATSEPGGTSFFDTEADVADTLSDYFHTLRQEAAEDYASAEATRATPISRPTA